MQAQSRDLSLTGLEEEGGTVMEKQCHAIRSLAGERQSLEPPDASVVAHIASGMTAAWLAPVRLADSLSKLRLQCSVPDSSL